MSAIPTWLTGRNVTITIVPQTVGATGTLTPGTSAALASLWDSVTVELDTVSEEISAADGTRQHTVILKESQTLNITQIAVNQGTGNKLISLLQGADVFAFTVAHGTAGSWTGFVMRKSIRTPYVNGKVVIEASFAPCDAGVSFGFA